MKYGYGSFFLLTCCFVCSSYEWALGTHDPQSEIPVDPTISSIGPVPLGELFRNREDQEKTVEKMTRGRWPSELDIISSFNKINVWILDRKRCKNGDWELDFVERPNILLEGPLSFDLKSTDGSLFTLSIMQVEALDTSFKEGGKKRGLRVLIKTDSTPYSTIATTNVRGMNFFSNYIYWDSKGSVTWRGKKP